MTKKQYPTNEYNSPEENAELGFNKWFYQDFYGPFSFRFEYFMDDINIQDENQRKDILIKWLNSAFISGYECALYAKLETEVENDNK
jgi:hypothetical protein